MTGHAASALRLIVRFLFRAYLRSAPYSIELELLRLVPVMTAIAASPLSMFSHTTDSDEYNRYTDPTFSSSTMDMSISSDRLYTVRPGQQHNEVYPASTIGFEPGMYAETPAPFMVSQHSNHSRNSPGMYGDDSDMRLGSSTLSTTSAPSAASSAIGSPQSHQGHGSGSMAEWGAVTMANVQPTIVSTDYMTSNGEYTAYGTQGMDDFVLDFAGGKTFVGELQYFSSILVCSGLFPSFLACL